MSIFQLKIGEYEDELLQRAMNVNPELKSKNRAGNYLIHKGLNLFSDKDKVEKDLASRLARAIEPHFYRHTESLASLSSKEAMFSGRVFYLLSIYFYGSPFKKKEEHEKLTNIYNEAKDGVMNEIKGRNLDGDNKDQ